MKIFEFDLVGCEEDLDREWKGDLECKCYTGCLGTANLFCHEFIIVCIVINGALRGC